MGEGSELVEELLGAGGGRLGVVSMSRPGAEEGVVLAAEAAEKMRGAREGGGEGQGGDGVISAADGGSIGLGSRGGRRARRGGGCGRAGR